MGLKSVAANLIAARPDCIGIRDRFWRFSAFSRYLLQIVVEAEISSLSSYGQSSPLDFESVSDGVGKM